jgi:hypothetical protein
LLWQSADAVAHVIDAYWPDVTRADLEAALRAYRCAQRSRSLGFEGEVKGVRVHGDLLTSQP